MEARIYKPKRLRNGKRTIGRLYRARVKLTGDNKVRDIPLGVCDKQVAQQKLNKLIQELEHESAGLIPAKPERETAQSPLLDLVSEYVNELTILGRSADHLRHVRTRLHLLVRECRWTRLADVTPASFQSWRKEQTTKAPNGVPDMDEVRTDLEKAGIPFLDERGRRIDYHALRTTFITRLSTMKVHPRVAMELARHSDMRLTMKTYTDVGQLPLREVMDSLPGFGSDSRIDSRNLGPTGQTVSQPVTEKRELKTENTIANKGESHDLTAAVPVCHSEPESGGFGIRIPLSPPVFKSFPFVQMFGSGIVCINGTPNTASASLD